MEKKDDRISFLLKNIQRIKDGMTTLDSDRAEALRYYRSDPEIVDAFKGRSKATTTDLMDVVEWAKPALLEIFAGGDEVCSLEPASEEDVQAVEKQHILVNHQLRVKNNWFLVMHDWLDDMLKLKVGWIKYQWYREIKHVDREYEGWTEEEYQAKKMQPNVEILSVTQREVGQTVVQDPNTLASFASPVYVYDCKVRYIIEDEYPLIEAVPAEEFGFPIKCKDIAEADFCYHRVRYKKWKFIKEFGEKKFEQVEGVQKAIDDNSGTVEKERFADLGGSSFFYDKDKDDYIVYECYFFDEETGEPKIAKVCADVILSEEDNKYGKPPFHGITPIRMAHRVAGFSMYDLVKQLQEIRTAFLRQILDNLYFANNRRYFGDVDRINMDDYLDNNFPGALVRTQGDPRAIVMPEEKAPLPPETFQFWEMLNVEKDYHSGVPRSFQGVNPNVLNKTWRGQNQQVSQASQRILMMARLIAEMGVAPLVSDIVDLNVRFLKKSVAVRYLNDWVDIEPDNIIGKYDRIVNVGLGTGNKDQVILYMQQLLGLFAQIRAAGVSIVTPMNVYNAMRELVKAMGFRNTADFVTDPKFSESIQMLIATLVQTGAVQHPQIAAVAQQVAAQMGMLPNKNAQAQAGTFPGQEPPAIPEQPFQPMQPPNLSQGGNIA